LNISEKEEADPSYRRLGSEHLLGHSNNSTYRNTRTRRGHRGDVYQEDGHNSNDCGNDDACDCDDGGE